MNDSQILGQGISFPPHVGADGRLAWSKGAENIREAIRVVLMTEPRERIMLPEFGSGLGAFLFEPNITTTHRLMEERIRQALARWTPRITLENIEIVVDPDDAQNALVTITYRLVATGARENVNLTVRVGG